MVKKSAPMVALYWLENFLFTYWFMREVLPTPLFPMVNSLIYRIKMARWGRMEGCSSKGRGQEEKKRTRGEGA